MGINERSTLPFFLLFAKIANRALITKIHVSRLFSSSVFLRMDRKQTISPKGNFMLMCTINHAFLLLFKSFQMCIYLAFPPLFAVYTCLWMAICMQDSNYYSFLAGCCAVYHSLYVCEFESLSLLTFTSRKLTVFKCLVTLKIRLSHVFFTYMHVHTR